VASGLDDFSADSHFSYLAIIPGRTALHRSPFACLKRGFSHGIINPAETKVVEL